MPGNNKVMALDLSAAKESKPVESDRDEDESSQVSEDNTERSTKSFKYEQFGQRIQNLREYNNSRK